MRKPVLIAALLLLSALFLFGCTQPYNSTTNNNTSTTPTVPNTGTTTNTNPNGPDYFPNGTPGTTTTTTTTTTTAPTPVSINIANFAFSPNVTTVPVGTTVTWTNNDSTTHTVTENNGAFNSGDLANGQTYSYTFTTKGTYNYHCNIHPMMKATIIVQ